MRRRGLRLSVGCALAVTALVAAAAPVNAATTKAAASGPAIEVAFVNLDATSSTQPARQGATAAVRSINKAGGVAGRPIRLTECRTDQTPERGKACIDQVVAAKPSAVLAVQPGTATDSLAALAPTGVPYVGQTCNTTSTLSGQFATFCFGSDFVGLYASSASYLKSLGTVKKVLLPYINVPAAASGVKAYAVPLFQRAGITPVELPIPEGTADIGTLLTPALQQQNPDAVVGLLTGPGCITAMKLRSGQTTPKPLVLPAMCTDTDVLHDGGTGANGVLFVRQTIALDRRNADVRTYARALRVHAPGADPADPYVQAGFAAVMNLTTALRTVPSGTTVDAVSTTAALRGAKSQPLFLNPGATFTCDGTAYTGLKSLCSLQSQVVEYQGKNRWTAKGVF